MKIKVIYTERPRWEQEAQTFDLGELEFESVEVAREEMYRGFNNVVENPREGDLGYYSNKYQVRSMCMQDLVEIDGVTYVCCSSGWQRVSNPVEFQKWLLKEDPTFLDPKDVLRFNAQCRAKEEKVQTEKEFKPEIGFSELMDCVRYVDVIGYILRLNGKSHSFKDTHEVVPYVEKELGYKVIT